MAGKKWDSDQLETALQYYHTHKQSIRSVAAAYGIPKSTLADYVSGRSQIGCKQGPPTVLTAAEEARLVDYCVQMARIGYGRTREQVCLTVKKILDKDGRLNPFEDNLPGRKWWELFKKRHPEISLHQPMQLQLCRAQSCTSKVLAEWFSDFHQFLQMHSLKDQPALIWNADETGVSLCPKTGKVLALKSSRHVYTITGNSKEQITTLVAANAAGDVIPPMHIFPGERFKSNPMEGCVDRAYMGRSPNGWISTELFYGWLVNHFNRFLTKRPVILIVDGHSTHIDLEISKKCQELQIHLYCLPPHTSHVLQPLDVGFFSSFKTSWGKAFENYKFENPGVPLTKYSFASVFRSAWLESVKPSTIVNSFKESGICPFKPDVINEERLFPSQPMVSTSTAMPGPLKSLTVCQELEKLMKPDTLRQYQTRLEEGYDMEHDELYSIWKQLRLVTISDSATPIEDTPAIIGKLIDHQVEKQQTVSSVFDEILTYPKPKESVVSKRGKSTASLPKHLSGDQFIQYLQQKKDAKDFAEAEKKRQQEERVRKRKEKDEERARKLLEKEQKKVQKELEKAQKQHEKETRQKTKKKRTLPPVRLSPETSDHEIRSDSSAECYCPVCLLPENDIDPWIACDTCETWYHVHCVDLDDSRNLEEINWDCANCT